MKQRITRRCKERSKDLSDVWIKRKKEIKGRATLIFSCETAKEVPNFLRGTKRLKLPFILHAHSIEKILLVNVWGRGLVDFWRSLM